jgi:hypothetical protein
MRKTLSLCLYLLLVELVAISLVVIPVYAFTASQSTTGWVRTLNASGASAMFAASRPAQLSAVASVASVGSASLAIRLVTGLGWVGLGVAAGILLSQASYSSAELAAIKTGATPPGVFQVPGYGGASISNHGNCPGPTGCAVGFDQMIQVMTAVGGAYPFGLLPSGWSNQDVVAVSGTSWTWQAIHSASSPSTVGSLSTGSVPTADQINAWLSTLPSNDSLSLEARTTVAGVAMSPQPADQVVTQSVPAASVTTQVVPASQVGVARCRRQSERAASSWSVAGAERDAKHDHHDDDDHDDKPEWQYHDDDRRNGLGSCAVQRGES